MRKLSTILLAAVAAVTVLALTNVKARDKQKRSKNETQMLKMAVALFGYAADYNGYFPTAEGAKGVDIVLKTRHLPSAKEAINPLDKTRKAADEKVKTINETQCSYAYVGSGLRDDNSRGMPILWEKPYGGKAVLVSLSNMKRVTVTGPFKTNVDVVKAILKHPELKGKVNKEWAKQYLAAAKAMDAREAKEQAKKPAKVK